MNEAQTVIASDQHWALWAVLFVVAAFGLWAEQTRIGSKFSAAVIAIAGTFLLSNLSVIPGSAPSYDIVWSYLVPLAIPLLLFKADLKRILREAGPTLSAFGLGAVGTVLGTFIAFHLIPLGEHDWQLAGIFCATYVGGSMNFVAAAESLGLDAGDVLSAGVAADNLVMTVYFLVLFTLPSLAFFRRFFPVVYEEEPLETVKDAKAVLPEKAGISAHSRALALAFAICAVSFRLAEFLPVQGLGILIVTALTVLVATLFPEQMKMLEGTEQTGVLLMQVFFAAIGASANIPVVLKVGPVLFLFAGLILFVHLCFLLVAGKLFRLNLGELIIASNANMGGPTTAAAMAASRKWNALVLPAILCGTFGYAIATFIGVGVGYWLR